MSLSLEQDAQLAIAAIQAISQIVDAIRGASNGQTDPSLVLKALADLQSGLAKNDSNADQALDTKFPT